jgi:hypothetical protein
MDQFLDELCRLEGRGSALNQQHCADCPGLPRFRCSDCMNWQLYCQTCIIQHHKCTPLHIIEASHSSVMLLDSLSQQWTDEHFFSRVSLASLGHRIQLGDHATESCPYPNPMKKPFCILHTNGIHFVQMDFCGCCTGVSNTRNDHVTQLLRAQLFPATVDNPRTAATFECCNAFHILSFESKVSLYEYYNTLSRLTDNTGLCNLVVRLVLSAIHILIYVLC